MTENEAKLTVFFEIAQALNHSFGSVPILYGSLGLSLAVGQELNADDIDLLIEQSIFNKDLTRIRQRLEVLGFRLTNPKENEFQRGPIKIGLSHDGDLMDFAGIDPARLAIATGPVPYRTLSPEQYLAAYRASANDGYRRDTKQKDDATKIALLEAFIGARSTETAERRLSGD